MDLEPILRSIAPRDLDGVPLYVVTAGDLPAELRLPGADGWTSKNLDVALADHLRGRWAGRGPALVVSSPDAVGIALHELAHVLEKPLDLSPVQAGEHREASGALAVACAADCSVGFFAGEPWRHHGAAYVRIALHVLTRHNMRECRRRVHPGSLLLPGFFDPHLWAYYDAIAPEAGRLADCSFAEIRATRPPAEFIALWRADVTAWLARQSQTEQAAVVAAQALRCFES